MTHSAPRRRLAFGLVSLALLVSSPAWAASDLRSEIEAANKNFEAIFSQGDSSGIAGLYTDEAQLLPAQSDFVTGTKAIQEFWQAAFDAGLKRVSLVTLEVEGHGHTAHEVGRLELRDADGKVVDRAKYIVIWKKQGDSWKLHRDIWTTSVVPVQK